VPTTKAGVFSYSGDPANSALDQTRFLIGDTDPDDAQLLDGEIKWLLSQYNNTPLNAAIRATETIIVKYSRQVDEAVGQVKINFSQRMKNYQQTLNMLRQRLAMEDATPFAGGISHSANRLNRQNRDLIRPDFTKHMMENDQIAPWTTQPQHWLWLNFGD
jgi:hypothetical protein